MATKKYKETVASVIALAVGAFLLGRVKRRTDETVAGGPSVYKEVKSELAVVNNLKKYVGLFGCHVHVFYNWNTCKYTLSTVRLPDIDYYFYRIQYVYPGSHYLDLLRPYHVENWRKTFDDNNPNNK